MRDATYVVLALALCMIILLVTTLIKPAPSSMLDLAEFKTLPVELRTILRRVLPDPLVIRQRWSTMTPDQKQMVVQQISGMIPQPRPPVPVPRPEPVPEPVPEPAPEPEGLKKGFLLGDAKKKNPKDKKKNKVVTLGSVAPDGDASGDGFLGSDQ
jgi:outer membrane biosynthesis protein TonB